MKTSFAILFALILLSVYADISLSHTNADDQTFLLEFKTPTADPSGTVLRVELTLTTQHGFAASNEQTGAICTVTPDGGSFPTGVSDTFALTVFCGASTLCPPGAQHPAWILFLGSLDNTGGTLDYTYSGTMKVLHPYLDRSSTGSGTPSSPYVYTSSFEFTAQEVADYHLPTVDGKLACFFEPDNRLHSNLNTTRSDINSTGMFTEVSSPSSPSSGGSGGDLANQSTSSAEGFSLVLSMTVVSIISIF